MKKRAFRRTGDHAADRLCQSQGKPGRGVIRDPKAEEIIRGLDTRCCRMSGYAHWYNLDLPEAIAVRKRLMPEDGTVSQIAMSAMEDWGPAVEERDAPALVIIEGLTMYLSEAEVRRIFAVIAGRFDRAAVLVEPMNPTVVRHFKKKTIEGSHAQFTWGVKNGAALAFWISL